MKITRDTAMQLWIRHYGFSAYAEDFDGGLLICTNIISGEKSQRIIYKKVHKFFTEELALSLDEC